MPAMNINKDTLMKVGIAVAVALIIYLILRSVTCSKREQYASFVPPSAPGRWRREGYATYKHPRPIGRRRTRPANDYSEEEFYPEVEADMATDPDVTSVPPLMESTLDDAQANAEFLPDE